MPDVHKPKAQKLQAQKPQAKKPKPEPADVQCPACYLWTAEYVAECLMNEVWAYQRVKYNYNYDDNDAATEKAIRIIVKMTRKYGVWFDKHQPWHVNNTNNAVPCPCPLCKGTGRVIPDLCTAYVLAGGNGALTIKAIVALRKALSG